MVIKVYQLRMDEDLRNWLTKKGADSIRKHLQEWMEGKWTQPIAQSTSEPEETTQLTLSDLPDCHFRATNSNLCHLGKLNKLGHYDFVTTGVLIKSPEECWACYNFHLQQALENSKPKEIHQKQTREEDFKGYTTNKDWNDDIIHGYNKDYHPPFQDIPPLACGKEELLKKLRSIG